MKRLLILVFIILGHSVLGQYADPKKRKIRDLVILYDTTVGRTQGSLIPMGVILEKKNGSIAVTQGFLKGKLSWSSFNVKVRGGEFSNGNIKIHRDYYEDSISVTVSHSLDKNFSKSILIPLNHKGHAEIVISGRDGRDGNTGKNGYATSTNGTAGGKGENGENGEDGPELDVLVELKEGSEGKFLLLDITDMKTFQKRQIKVNTDGGSLLLTVKGGDGGQGGRGGRGGPGTGTGLGGNGGAGGNGGDGGRGGKVTIRFTAAAKPYAKLITINNPGGKGGKAGPGGFYGPSGANQGKNLAGIIFESAVTIANNGNQGKEGSAGPEIETVFLE
jgi:hypothetical protein